MVEFESRKRKLNEMAGYMGSAVLDEVGMRPGPPKEIQIARGDLTEKELLQELKKFYSTASDQEVAVFHGPQIRKPGASKAFHHESDFVIVNKNSKTIINIELKHTLTGKAGSRAIEQTHKLKSIARALTGQCIKSSLVT